VDGYLQIPNRIADHLLPLLAPHSQLVYFRLYRLSWGFGKTFCTVSLPKLAEKTQLSQSSVQRAIADLESKGLLRKSQRIFGKSRAQGVTYEVVTGTSLVPETSLVRRTSLVRETNNKYLKENIKSDIQENPVYEVRKIAARLREINLNAPGYTLERLRADVRTAVDGQGLDVDEAVFDEALRGITL
jgi:DNA-binding transcriptional MocR family regulator